MLGCQVKYGLEEAASKEDAWQPGAFPTRSGEYTEVYLLQIRDIAIFLVSKRVSQASFRSPRGPARAALLGRFAEPASATPAIRAIRVISGREATCPITLARPQPPPAGPSGSAGPRARSRSCCTAARCSAELGPARAPDSRAWRTKRACGQKPDGQSPSEGRGRRRKEDCRAR
jgi:hypothetical protein